MSLLLGSLDLYVSNSIIYYLSLKMHHHSASKQNEESLWASLKTKLLLIEQNFYVKICSQVPSSAMTSSWMNFWNPNLFVLRLSTTYWYYECFTFMMPCSLKNVILGKIFCTLPSLFPLPRPFSFHVSQRQFKKKNCIPSCIGKSSSKKVLRLWLTSL